MNLSEYLQNTTVYDEDVIGCFLNNYGISSLCGAAQNSGCKEAARCQHLATLTIDKCRKEAVKHE